MIKPLDVRGQQTRKSGLPQSKKAGPIFRQMCYQDCKDKIFLRRETTPTKYLWQQGNKPKCFIYGNLLRPGNAETIL